MLKFRINSRHSPFFQQEWVKERINYDRWTWTCTMSNPYVCHSCSMFECTYIFRSLAQNRKTSETSAWLPPFLRFPFLPFFSIWLVFGSATAGVVVSAEWVRKNEAGVMKAGRILTRYLCLVPFFHIYIFYFKGNMKGHDIVNEGKRQVSTFLSKNIFSVNR